MLLKFPLCPVTTLSTLNIIQAQPTQISRRICVPSNPVLARAMSASAKSNETGLPPSESMKLQERSVQPNEQRIVDAVKELYSCKPRVSSYEVYAPNATFRDPVGIAEGLPSIKAQFNGLAQLFPRADITKFRLLSQPSSSQVPKGTILIDQDVAYYRDPSSSSPTKTVNSLLTIYVDGNVDPPVITKHVEEWNHQKDASKDDGFFGMLNDYRKKITAKVVDTFVSQDPPPSKY